MMFRTLSAWLITGLFLTGTAIAQDHDHAHDHSAHDHTTHAVAPKDIDIDHVFTEASDDHSIGSEIAPVSMIIYASVTCPHCSDWFTNEWPAFKTDHVDTGDVRVTFREFPTAPAQLAMAGFLLANCAPEDRFFDNIVYQMEKQPQILAAAQIGKGAEAYAKVAQMAGLMDPDAMNACFAEKEGFDRIGRSMKRAEAGGIAGVPAFIVDGAIYTEDTTAEALSGLVSRKLSTGMTPIPGK